MLIGNHEPGEFAHDLEIAQTGVGQMKQADFIKGSPHLTSQFTVLAQIFRIHTKAGTIDGKRLWRKRGRTRPPLRFDYIRQGC